jgi:hypothetical protein
LEKQKLDAIEKAAQAIAVRKILEKEKAAQKLTRAYFTPKNYFKKNKKRLKN